MTSSNLIIKTIHEIVRVFSHLLVLMFFDPKTHKIFFLEGGKSQIPVEIICQTF